MTRKRKGNLSPEVRRQLDQLVSQPLLNCQEDERPPVLLTPAAIVALRDHAPTLAIPNDPTQDTYDCPFCNSECTRDYCYACRSELLESEIENDAE